MISYDEIRQLQQYSSGTETSILTLYVNVDQSNAANLNRGFETEVENAFRRMAEAQSVGANHKEKLSAECERILRFIRGYTPKGRGMVIFSDSTQDFWWQRDLQVGVQTEARWSQYPWVRPLLEMLEGHDRFAVVLIDKQHAKLLTIDATGIEHQTEIVSDVPNKHATTGTDHIWSQGQMERDHTKHIKWHINRVSDELSGMLERMKINRVIVGGPVEATSMFMNEIPKQLQQMVIDTVALPIDANYDRLVGELRSIQERVEQRDELKLVESMITAAMKGDRAVLGISETLQAIQEQRVYSLVIAKGYRLEGKQCSSCQVLTLEGGEACSFCGGKLEPAPDLINRASHKVLDQAGKVQIVTGGAAEKLVGTGIGAVLRF